MKLARSIILLLLATFLPLLATLHAFEVRRGLREFDRNLASNMAHTGRALRPALVEVRQQEGPARALEVLKRADADVVDVEIGWIALSPPPAMLSGELLAELAAGHEVSVARPAATPDRLYVFVPVSGEGALQLSQPIPSEKSVLLRLMGERLLSALAAVGAAAAIAVAAGVWMVGRPMARLVEQARRIGTGDLSHGAAMARGDEIGQLAGEMNGMCDRLLEARVGMAAAADARINALEQVRRADRLSTVGTLASGMAHELGTPLSIITGRAKMIAANDPTSESAQFARIIGGQADKMTRIMRGLLDFARRKSAEKQAVDLRDVARRTLDLLGPFAKKRDVSLRLAGDDAAIAEVDATQVEQALANLVVNGVHAMGSGGELVVHAERVRSRPPQHPEAPEASWLRLRVEDHGDGIAPSDLPHVFEPFFTTKDVGEGTGLGLSVTYGIVQDHGGFIDVESEPGRGCSFSLYFPAPVAA